MNLVREHAYDPALERRLFSVVIDSRSELSSQVGLPARHFACLLAWDARGVSAETISSLVASLLCAGASYFVCWGPDCERVHDIIDELASDPDNVFGTPPDSSVTSTWHDSETEPLRDALWFFLANTCLTSLMRPRPMRLSRSPWVRVNGRPRLARHSITQVAS